MGRVTKLLVVLAAVLATTFMAPGNANAETGIRCNLHVCFDVHGSKLHVVSADGYYANKTYRPYCGYMIVFVGGKQAYRSSAVCTVPFGWNAKPMHVNIKRNFANGTKICAEIRGVRGHSNLAGHPCITVHS